jgi:hypothetical protein
MVMSLQDRQVSPNKSIDECCREQYVLCVVHESNNYRKNASENAWLGENAPLMGTKA